MFSIFSRSRILGQGETLAEAECKARSLLFLDADLCIYQDSSLALVLFRNGSSMSFGIGPVLTPAEPMLDLDALGSPGSYRHQQGNSEKW